MRRSSILRDEIRPFRPGDQNHKLHITLLQAVTFAYFVYRFLSRDYAIYGELDSSVLEFARPYFSTWPVPFAYIFSGVFIYDFIPFPSYQVLHALQWTAVIASILGLMGLFPRISAIICFLVLTHFTGIIQAADGEVEGGTVLLCALFCLTITPSRALYRLGKRRPNLSPDYQWPLWILFALIGSYYTYAGLNKIVHVGIDWPLRLHLENLAGNALNRSLFVSSSFADPWVATVHLDPRLSIVGGILTLLGELFFITILFLPRFRLFFVGNMCALHILVFLTAGINFLGSSFILLLCLDWSALARPIRVFGSPLDPISLRVVRLAQNSARVRFEKADSEFSVVDSNGSHHYGVDAIDRLACSSPVLYPLALCFRIPGGIWVYRLVSNIARGGNSRP